MQILGEDALRVTDWSESRRSNSRRSNSGRKGDATFFAYFVKKDFTRSLLVLSMILVSLWANSCLTAGRFSTWKLGSRSLVDQLQWFEDCILYIG